MPKRERPGAGRREGSRAPTQPQGTEKTMNQNLAE